MKQASREVVDCLGAFLQRNTRLPSRDVRMRMDDLAAGRLRTPDSADDVVVAPSVEATPAPDDGSPCTLETQGASGGAHDPRPAALRARYRTVHAPIDFPEGTLKADDVGADDVLRRLTRLKDRVAAQVQAGFVPWVDVPDLHQSNTLYDDRGNVFLGHNVRRWTVGGPSGKACVRLLLTLEAAMDNLRNGVCTTKRGLYYRHQAKLADGAASQVDSDRALASLASTLGVRRRALGFVEARRGLVYGRLVLRDGDNVIDLSRVGPAGHAVPRFTDDTEVVSSDAAFILVVEKMTVAFALAQVRWWDSGRCIVVCGEGFPSLSTREFVRTLVDTLGIPAVVLVDADPAGVRNALTYAHGSISTALETPWLACNNVWWAGIHPSDIASYCGNQDMIRFEDVDSEAARLLIEHPSGAYANNRVRDEVAILLDRQAKVELDGIARDLPRLIDDYMPKKLFDSELVKL